MNNSQQLRKGIISILVANIIGLIVSVLTNFLLPKYLSVESYAQIKTYQLYLSYAGILHLGYVDGMLLKYGGVDVNNLDKRGLCININTFRIFQILICLLFLPIVFFIRSSVYLAFVISIFTNNLISYFSTLFQAVGEFSRYSVIKKLSTISVFLVNVILIFILKTDNYLIYVIGYIVVNYLIWIYLECCLYKIFNYRFFSFCFSKNELVRNIKDGVLLMLGNFSNALLTGMDRWFIKALLYDIDFAQYSFAVSMEHFVDIAIGPLSVTLYNYFCKVTDVMGIKKLRNCVLMFSLALISIVFPIRFIIQVYLTKYSDSHKTLIILFGAQVFYISIKCIYVNLYKARKMQTKYFKKLVLVIVIGFILNAILYMLFHVKEAFALGTFLSAVLWYLISSRDFKVLNHSLSEMLYVFISVLVFMIVGYVFNPIVGFVIYILYFVLVSFILMRDTTIYLCSLIVSKFKR